MLANGALHPQVFVALQHGKARGHAAAEHCECITHATHSWFGPHSGVAPLQSLIAVHSTQVPVAVSQAGVGALQPALLVHPEAHVCVAVLQVAGAQWTSIVHATQAPAVVSQAGVGAAQSTSIVQPVVAASPPASGVVVGPASTLVAASGVGATDMPPAPLVGPPVPPTGVGTPCPGHEHRPHAPFASQSRTPMPPVSHAHGRM